DRAKCRTCSCVNASARSLLAVVKPTVVHGWLVPSVARDGATESPRLMRQERIFARQRSKYRPATTDSRHGGPIAPNRLRHLCIRRPDQVWATDATCILTSQGWLYLVAVLDLFTRRVIGWSMHTILDASLVIAALRMALAQRRPIKPLIIHSDRGAQFASAAYRHTLAQHGLLASMARKGNCYDNAFIESFWSSLKYELVYHHHFATLAEARNAIFHYI